MAHRTLLPVLVAALGAVAYLLLDPPSADLAAQAFRTDLFEREGFTLFNTAWYGGHHTPGYSVLFPPLAAALDERVVGAVAAVGATAAFAALAGRTAGLLVVPALVASLVSGRLTFVLGTAFAIGAVLAAARGRTWLAALGGIATALASPVAALFAALAGAAMALAARGGGQAPATLEPEVEGGGGQAPATLEREVEGEEGQGAGVALAVGAVVPVAFLVLAFPEGGTFPFAVSAFLPAFVAGVAVAVVAPPGALRSGAALYALLCLAAFVVPSPVGGNATRLGVLVAAPVAFLLLWPRRRLALALLALPLAYWVLQPAVRDVRRAAGDPSTERAFHRPLLAYLDRRDGARVRLEIPFTQSRGETVFVAPRVALARGWERQLDRERNALFYDDATLTAQRYLRWLRRNAIAYVALPEGVPLDASAEDERRLLLSGRLGAALTEAGRPGRWRVWRVAGERPLASGVATLTRLRPEGFVLRARRAGTSTVRVRYTPYWELASGRGCIGPAPGGWTQVRAEQPGRIAVQTRFGLGRVRASSPRCR